MKHIKLVYGIGINDADYVISSGPRGKRTLCPFYSTWKNMLGRCYHTNHPAYSNCTVEKDWKTFSKFKKWMSTQAWEGNQLDKDILIPNNKVYSHKTCIFIPQSINKLLTGNPGGIYPKGVYKHTKGRFKATCKKEGKSTHIGIYNSVEEASEAYILFKNDLIEEAARNSPEPLKSALRRHMLASH